MAIPSMYGISLPQTPLTPQITGYNTSTPVMTPVVPGVVAPASAIANVTADPAVAPGFNGWFNGIMGNTTAPNSSNSGSTPFGANLGTAGLALGGLQTLAGIYSAFQGQQLAEDTFDFQKRTTQANMANQIQSYNTTLADRIRARAIGEGGHNGGMIRGDVQPYLRQNQLKPTFLG